MLVQECYVHRVFEGLQESQMEAPAAEVDHESYQDLVQCPSDQLVDPCEGLGGDHRCGRTKGIRQICDHRAEGIGRVGLAGQQVWAAIEGVADRASDHLSLVSLALMGLHAEEYRLVGPCGQASALPAQRDRVHGTNHWARVHAYGQAYP